MSRPVRYAALMSEPREPLTLDLSVRALEPPTSFVEATDAFGLSFDEGDLERLGLFLAHLLDANTRMNLTGITQPEEAWHKHVLDALTLLPMLSELEHGSRVLDVGSGGGVPGVPLAIVTPKLRFTLMDATAKKTDFIGQAAAAVRASNVETATGRAEELGQDRGVRRGDERVGGHREAYDAVVARAVGPLAVVAELTTPFAKVGGLTLLVKGGRAEDELSEAKQALHLLHVAEAGVVETPTGRVVVLEKLRRTPKAYPRRVGEPKRRPLSQ